ncbi:MAG TPA: FAD-dependent oxidoreductase [Hanamia sp.]|nr:FAD-dependent oxidoreductase [Hanamia sp.]
MLTENENINELFNFNRSITKPVAIIGGGIAGLTAANFLKQKNIPFILFEAGNKIAGLAMSFKDKDGFSNDFGAHFITNRLAKAIGLEKECKTVKYYGESVWINDKSYSYPFGLMAIPRMSFSFLKSGLKRNKNKTPPGSIAELFRTKYGESLANEIALPLIEAWSGAPSEQLSAAIADSLPKSILKTIYLKIASKITGRAVGCGYNREKPELPSVWHVYPNGGVARLCTKLAEDLDDSIRLQSPVKEIIVKNEKAVAVTVKDEQIDVSAVISTAPANILSKMVNGTDAFERIADFRFRPMLFVNMRFNKRNILPDTVLWLPEHQFPFFRLTEVTRSMPWLAPEGKSIITADIGCEKDDEFWNMDEEKLVTLCLKKMTAIFPHAETQFLKATVLRTPYAYPIFLNEYEAERRQFENSTKIENLLSIGRNGEFAHRFMEDIYWRTREKVESLIKKMSFNERNRFYSVSTANELAK